ncbi:MAG: hypothetical protein KGN36_02510 [Acidobacteriota bacterium]|nr:hypothetical protein [Acidobacteriota bacterium]
MGRRLAPEYRHVPVQPDQQDPPSQTLILHFADYADKTMMAMSQAMPARSPTKIFAIKGSFSFSDGMCWVGNRYSIPDPQRPGQCGDREKNWPVPGHHWGSR